MNAALAIRPAVPGAHPAAERAATIETGRPTMPVLSQAPSRRRADEIQFSFVYHATFPIFLVSAVARRLLSGRRPAASGLAGESLSIVREAKASAQTCGSFSLMG